jgi:hypothetical protein
MKKVLAAALVMLVGGVGGLFLVNGKSHYDPSKYSLEIKPENLPFGIGSQIRLVLPDQFDRVRTLDPETEKLIFVFTKATGHTFKTYMADKPKGYLEKRKIAVVADISGMPTVIVNTFAIPDFQQSTYNILLIYDKEMAKRLKEGQKTDRIIVMTLDHGKVTAIDHAIDLKSLGELIGS